MVRRSIRLANSSTQSADVNSRDCKTSTLASCNTSFEFFPRLPIELRHKVWDEACYVTRVVDVRASLLTGSDYSYEGRIDALFDVFEKPAIHFRSDFYCIPPILHASSESRLVGLKHYKLDFGTDCRIDGEVCHQQVHIHIKIDPIIYINRNYDVVCIVDDSEDRHDRVYTAVLISMLENFRTKAFPRIAIRARLVTTFTDEVCTMLAAQNGTEVILFESDAAIYKRYQLDPDLEWCSSYEIIGPRSTDLLCANDQICDLTEGPAALHFTSGVPFYNIKDKKPYGMDFSGLNETIKLLVDGVNRIRNSEPELHDLKLLSIKPMALICHEAVFQ